MAAKKIAGGNRVDPSRRPVSPIVFTVSAYDVRKKRERASALDLERETALMLGARSGNAAGKNLTALGRITAKPVGILVVDLSLLGAKAAYLLAEEYLALASLTAIVRIAHGVLHLHIGFHIFHLFIRHTKSPCVGLIP